MFGIIPRTTVHEIKPVVSECKQQGLRVEGVDIGEGKIPCDCVPPNLRQVLVRGVNPVSKKNNANQQSN